VVEVTGFIVARFRRVGTNEKVYAMCGMEEDRRESERMEGKGKRGGTVCWVVIRRFKRGL
jgi:hypothetical protein